MVKSMFRVVPDFDDDDKKAIDPELAIALTVVPETGDTATKPANRRVVTPQSRRRTCCVNIIILVLTLAAIAMASAGGYYAYRSYRIKHMERSKGYTGKCGVGVNSVGKNRKYLTEEVDIYEEHETIKVPKFDDNDEATFYHDFAQNISVIQDVTKSVCYILPLDRSEIPPPRDFMDALFAALNGDYVYDAEEIRTEYRVVHPELDRDVMRVEYGNSIADMCSGYQSYKLTVLNFDHVHQLIKEQISKQDTVMRRAAPSELSLKALEGLMTTTTTMARPYIQRNYVMYPGGRIVVQYTIYW